MLQNPLSGGEERVVAVAIEALSILSASSSDENNKTC